MQKKPHNSGTNRKRFLKLFVSILTAVLLISFSSAVAVGETRWTQNVETTSIIIGFENEINEELPERYGGETTNELKQLGALVVDLPSHNAVEALNTWESKPNVDYVEVDGTMSAHGQTTPWGIDRIGAPEAQDVSGGDGIDVAILDTGIDPNHETLDVEGGYAVETARGPYDEDWADDEGHGTHCAGTAAALDNDIGVLGTAPEVDLWAVKVLDNSGSGSWSGVAEGIEWAADNDMEVISMSLGGGHSDTVQDAVEYAYSEGSLMVASAGNDYGDPVNYPAAYEEVIAVSATDEDDEIADFSSTGPNVELAAPGVDVLSTYPGDDYTTMSGTSMSAPHVSGVAAMVYDVLGLDASDNDPSDVDEVREQLQVTAEDIGLDEEKQGHGLVDAAEAVGAEPVDEHDISITYFEGDTVIQGETAEIDITVENTGDFDYTGEDGVEIQVVNDDTGETLLDEMVELESGESYTDVATWDTTEDTEAGDYTISGDTEAIMDGEVVATDSDTTIVTVEEDDDEEDDDDDEETTAPEIVTFDVDDNSNPQWARVEVDWEVFDDDGNLETVELEMIDSDGNVVDSETNSVSGESASGTDELRDRQGSGEYDIVLTVTDTDGNTTTETKTIEL